MESLPENCNDVRALLPLFVGEDLETSEVLAVRAHLDGCAACAADFERARSARGALIEECRRSAEATAVAPQMDDLWGGVRAVLLEEGLIRTSLVASSSSDAQPLRAAGASSPSGMRRAASPLAERALPLRRLWVGSLSAAAAVVFAFFLASTLTPEEDLGAFVPASGSVAFEAPPPSSGLSATLSGGLRTVVDSSSSANIGVSDPISVIPVGQLSSPLLARRPQAAHGHLRPATAEDEHLIDRARVYYFLDVPPVSGEGGPSALAGNRGDGIR